MKTKKEYALVPCEDKVYVCEFDGTFEEGEGVSMGQVVNWKNPNNTKEILVACMLNNYKEYVDYWVKYVIEKYNVKRVYVEGLSNATGWWNKEDVGLN